MTAANRGVFVVADDADHYVRDEVAASLRRHGERVVFVPASEIPLGAQSVVVIVSAALERNDFLIAHLLRLRDERLVTVRTGAVGDSEKMKFLNALNAILWDVTAPVLRESVLFTAVHSDVVRYREGRALQAQAVAWHLTGRDPDYLISDRRAVRAAIEHDRAARSDPLAASGPLLRDFLTACSMSSRRLWWKRNRRWAFRSGMVAVIALVVVFGVVIANGMLGSNLLAASLLVNDDHYSRPDLQAIKLIGFLDEQSAAERPIPSSTAGQVMLALSRPWDLGVLGYEHDAALTGFALVEDHSGVVTVDSKGTLARWSTADGSMSWRRQLSDVPLTALASTSTGSQVVSVDARNVLRHTDTRTWRSEGRSLAASVAQVVLSATGSVAVTVTTEGEVQRVDFGTVGDITSAGRFDRVLDVRATPAGPILALVRTGELLEVLDTGTGQPIDQIPWHAAEFERGALSHDGTAAVVTGADGQLWFAADHLRFTPTGRAVPDVVGELAITAQGRVLFVSAQFSAQLFDPRTSLTVQICTTVGTVDGLALSPDGNRVVCSTNGFGVYDDLSRRFPVLAPPEGMLVQDARTASAAKGGLVQGVSIDVRGHVTVRLAGRPSVDLDPSALTPGYRQQVVGATTARMPWVAGVTFGGGSPTVVAVHRNGSSFTVGSSNGTITEIDAKPDGTLAMAGRWTTPDRAPVTGLGWNGRGGTVFVRTGTDRWWYTRSCVNCGRSLAALGQAVRDRMWICYTAVTLNLFTARSLHNLGLRRCAPSLQPER